MREMFHRIAPRYDFITRVFSYGMDKRWKRVCVERAALPANAIVLDLASGTGDFSTLITERVPNAKTVAVDLTERMLRLARGRGVRYPICADAARLPFASECFDCVLVGYGLRNFKNLNAALREMERVTKRGGMLITLDFFLPVNRVLRALYLGYLYVQGFFWGLVLHGRPRIYTYIPDSLRSFVSIGELSELLRSTGYRTIRACSFLLGGIGLHWAAKE